MLLLTIAVFVLPFPLVSGFFDNVELLSFDWERLKEALLDEEESDVRLERGLLLLLLLWLLLWLLWLLLL